MSRAVNAFMRRNAIKGEHLVPRPAMTISRERVALHFRMMPPRPKRKRKLRRFMVVRGFEHVPTMADAFNGRT